ncbi:MAG: hypothetical protein JO271_05385 [Verrucomicrobia bacterium]|nr:hypothetical protein [Verrucomicrobiota bacterium]
MSIVSFTQERGSGIATPIFGPLESGLPETVLYSITEHANPPFHAEAIQYRGPARQTPVD